MYVCPKCNCTDIQEVCNAVHYVDIEVEDGDYQYGNDDEVFDKGDSWFQCKNCEERLPVSNHEELIAFVSNLSKGQKMTKQTNSLNDFLKQIADTLEDTANFLTDEKILPCEEGNKLAEELADLAVKCRENTTCS
jgi:hypothetical protein